MSTNTRRHCVCCCCCCTQAQTGLLQALDLETGQVKWTSGLVLQGIEEMLPSPDILIAKSLPDSSGLRFLYGFEIEHGGALWWSKTCVTGCQVSTLLLLLLLLLLMMMVAAIMGCSAGAVAAGIIVQ